MVGKVEEIFGPINASYFTVKLAEGVVATSYAAGDKFYIAPDKLLPMERFLQPEKCARRSRAGARVSVLGLAFFCSPGCFCCAGRPGGARGAGALVAGGAARGAAGGGLAAAAAAEAARPAAAGSRRAAAAAARPAAGAASAAARAAGVGAGERAAPHALPLAVYTLRYGSTQPLRSHAPGPVSTPAGDARVRLDTSSLDSRDLTSLSLPTRRRPAPRCHAAAAAHSVTFGHDDEPRSRQHSRGATCGATCG